MKARVFELQRLFAFVSLFLFLGMMGGYVASLHKQGEWVYDGDDYVVGVDFVNFWMMGDAALHHPQPERYYDIGYYTQTLRARFDKSYRVSQWSYPPSYMLVAAPFGALPYYMALAIFLSSTMLLLLYAVIQATRPARLLAIIAIFASPASLIALISGQITLAATALQIFFFQLLDKRPYFAGLLLGILSIKPQLGLVYPVYLIATRRWKVFIAAALSTSTVFGFTLWFWGWKLWQAYIEIGAPMQRQFVLDGASRTIRAMMPTIYMDLHMGGISYERSMMVQAIVGMLVVSLFFTRQFRALDLSTQRLMVAAASVVSTPYLMAYDTLFLVTALVMWLPAQSLSKAGLSKGGFWLCIGCFFLPVLHFILGTFSIPGSALLPWMLMLWILKREKHT